MSPSPRSVPSSVSDDLPNLGSQHTALDRASWFSLRALVVAGGAWAALLIFEQLRVVLIPMAVAAIVASALRPLARRWEPRLGPILSAVASVLLVLFAAVALGGLAIWSVVGSAGEDLGPAISDAVDDAERWLEDGPLGVDPETIRDVTSGVGDGAASGTSIVSGVMIAGEVLAGTLLALVLSVFAVRDLDRAIEAIAARSAAPRRAKEALEAATERLRAYLVGVVALGTIEGVIIGTTVGIVASPGLGVGVAGVTFLAAFLPLVGAIVAGVIAVAAVLATAGVVPALITAGVAIAVQQLDSDLLAPVIYGRAASLHPVAILVSVTAGAALAGLAGAILAVPLTMAAVAARRAWTDTDDEPAPPDPSPVLDGAPPG